MERIRAFVAKRPNMMANIAPLDRPGVNGAFLLAVVNENKLRRILTRMLDEERFLSPLRHPFAVALAPRPPLRDAGRR